MDIVEKKGYRVLHLLASGGEGQVFICEKDGIRFILKVMPCMDSRQREILAQIDTLPEGFFPRVIETFADGEHTCLVREYIAGNTMREELQKSGSFSYSHALRVFHMLCEALTLLHRALPQPIVLRDLKPENIILTPDGGISLIDFGIARRYSPLASRDTIPAGTKGYTAPEAMSGFQSDPRSDVYSLGVVLYEMLSGKNLSEPPFQLRPLSESGVYAQAALDPVLAKATNPKPICRYASIAAFQEAVRRVRPRNPFQRAALSGILCFLAGVLLTLGLTSGLFESLFTRSGNTSAAQIDPSSIVGLSMEEAEALLFDQRLPITAYAVLNEAAQPDEVVSLLSSSDGIVVEVCAGRAGDIVAFPDPALDQAIHDLLAIPAEETIVASDLCELTVLDISGCGVVSLDGLQYAVNLTQLTAYDNAIKDLTPISHLGYLRALFLSDNKISDLSPLAHLSNLKALHMDRNQISDLSALNGIDLYDLSLGANNITDLSPLSNAVHMQRLNLYDNRISDFAMLSSMQSLSWLALNENQIADLTPLSRLSSLQTLLLSQNAINDIASISSNTGLVLLDLSSNYITDISALSALPKLETLDLSANTRLTDISILADLSNLETLNLAYLECCDYAPLLSFPALRTVTFCSPQSIQNTEELEWVIEQLQRNNITVVY